MTDQLNELGAALAKAQAEIQAARKDAANPFYHSKYADLAAIWDACRGPLTKNGLSVVQLPGFNPEHGFAFVTTILLHSSGQQISSTLNAPVMPQVVEKGAAPQITPQAVGSALTYLRRYALGAVAGVAPDDDDGEAASGRQRAPQQTAKPSKPKDAGPSEKQVDFFKKLIKSSKLTEDERVQMEDWLESNPSRAAMSKAIDDVQQRIKSREDGDEPIPDSVQREIDAANAGARK